jgi:putative endonuclease
VYILASKAGVLYTGITNNIKARVFQHKTQMCDGFTKKCGVNSLVYFETLSRRLMLSPVKSKLSLTAEK